MAEPTPTRAEAIRILEEGRAQIRALLDRVPKDDLERPGVGGGEWSPKDLLGHLASWEVHALEALDAWDRDERAPIDRELSRRRVPDINADDVAGKARVSLAQVLRAGDRSHRRLLEAIREMPDERWEGPPTRRGRRALGVRLGSILGGVGLFGHAQAHVPDLRTFIDTLGSPMA